MRRPAYAVLCAACALVFGTLSLPRLADAADTEPGPPALRKASDVAVPVDAEILDRQYRTLSSMPSVTVVYSALGPVRSVQGATGIVLSTSTRSLAAGAAAPEVLAKLKELLLAAGSETLKVRWNEMTATRRVINLDQFIGGIPVLYGGVSIQFEDATGLVDSVDATFLPDRGLPHQPTLTDTDAAKLAVQFLVKSEMAKAGSVKTSTPSLAYVGTHPDSTRGHLVWVVPATYTTAFDTAGDGIFWIDATDGELVGRDALSRAAALNVYSDRNVTHNPDTFPTDLTFLFSRPGSSNDLIAMNAYNNLLDSFQAIQAIGLWTQTLALGLVMHYGSVFDDAANARYRRVNSIDFIRVGDGWPASSIGPLGNSRDVMAHELGHGVGTSIYSPFVGDPSDAQGAAIDEGFGDVIASLVDTYFRPGRVPNDPATWTIAEIYTNNPAKGLRSMANPKFMDPTSRDWFPARDLSGWYTSAHDNATIMGHAFKLMANGPAGGHHIRAGQPILDSGVPGNIPSLFVPGIGPDKTWNIFFDTFRTGTMRNFPDFIKMKAAAVAAANTRYGAFEADAVDRAFRAVGVGVGCTAAPQAPQLEAVDRCPKWLLRWPSVPGATIYHGEMNPVIFQWVNALTIVNGDTNTCTRTVNTDYHAHVRACNGCGCSGWSNEVQMIHWPQCP